MAEDLSYLNDDQLEQRKEDSLIVLEALVKQYRDTEEKVTKADEALKAAKEAHRRVSQESIPQLLRGAGLSEVKLSDGTKVVVKDGVSVSVPAEKEQAFLAHLKKRGEEDIVKLELRFSRMETERLNALFEFLTNSKYEYEADRRIHPSTLKKYFKEVLGLDLEEEERAKAVAEGKALRPQDVESMANVFTYFETKLVEKKKARL